MSNRGRGAIGGSGPPRNRARWGPAARPSGRRDRPIARLRERLPADATPWVCRFRSEAGTVGAKPVAFGAVEFVKPTKRALADGTEMFERFNPPKHMSAQQVSSERKARADNAA